jgi:hypothetical protein
MGEEGRQFILFPQVNLQTINTAIRSRTARCATPANRGA